MTEFMHEVVARREATMRRPLVDNALPALNDMMREAYENMIAREMREQYADIRVQVQTM